MTPNLLDELEKIATGKLDKTAPSVIWLQLDTDGDNAQRDEPWAGRDGVTWCDESIGGLEIQYVRADLYRDMAKRLEAAERDAKRWRFMRAEMALGRSDVFAAMNAAIPDGAPDVRDVIEGYLDSGIDAAIDATQEGEAG